MELSSIRPAGWFDAISSIFLQIRPQFYFCLHCWLPITSIFEGIEKFQLSKVDRNREKTTVFIGSISSDTSAHFNWT